MALACSNSDVSLAVQAKREIGKLWEDLSKAPYKQLFHGGVAGPNVWHAVQGLRAIDLALSSESKKHTGRDSLICVHGNRFIEWAVLNALGVASGKPFTSVEGQIPGLVDTAVTKLLAAVKVDYADSYPASLFKNLNKCRVLATKM